MPSTPPLAADPTRPTARRLPRQLFGLVAAVGLTGAVLSLPSAGLSPAGASVRLSPTAAACADAGKATSDQAGGSRLKPGAQSIDPDTLTAAQVRMVEARTTRLASSLGLTENASGRLARTSSVLSSRSTSSTGARAAAKAAFTPTTVSVYWHVITDGTSGKLSSTTIGKQITVLNAAYKAAGFTFKLVRTDTTTNRDWFNTTGPTGNGANGDAADAKAMKTKLHVGTKASLNIYSVKFSDDTLGYSTFPFSGTLALDGDVFDYRSLPGGSLTGYNLGDTATHEIGHWFGLYHTFQGGCSSTRGDYVSDTPAEAYPAYDCTAKDSCPTLPGTDPIHNFMDYAPDSCMNTFTSGQRTRMQNEWLTYRSPSSSARRS